MALCAASATSTITSRSAMLSAPACRRNSRINPKITKKSIVPRTTSSIRLIDGTNIPCQSMGVIGSRELRAMVARVDGLQADVVDGRHHAEGGMIHVVPGFGVIGSQGGLERGDRAVQAIEQLRLCRW